MRLNSSLKLPLWLLLTHPVPPLTFNISPCFLLTLLPTNIPRLLLQSCLPFQLHLLPRYCRHVLSSLNILHFYFNLVPYGSIHNLTVWLNTVLWQSNACCWAPSTSISLPTSSLQGKKRLVLSQELDDPFLLHGLLASSFRIHSSSTMGASITTLHI